MKKTYVPELTCEDARREHTWMMQQRISPMDGVR